MKGVYTNRPNMAVCIIHNYTVMDSKELPDTVHNQRMLEYLGPTYLVTS